MKLVHCDGCGFTEPEDTPKSKRKIKPSTLTIIEDPRFPTGSENFDADLCINCRGMMLHEYFKVPALGSLELPAFLGPKRREDVASS